MGLLITLFILNSCKLGPTPTSHVSLKEEKNQEPLGQKDLRGCLAIPRRAKPISILNSEPGVGRAHLFGLPGPVGPVRSPAILNGLFWGAEEIYVKTTKFSSVNPIFANTSSSLVL